MPSLPCLCIIYTKKRILRKTYTGKELSLNKIAHLARLRSLAYPCMVSFTLTHDLNDFLSNLAFVEGANGNNYEYFKAAVHIYADQKA